MELAGIAFLFLTQIMRINLGQRSNKTEHMTGIVLFLVFSVFMLGFYIYYGFYTTFVIVLDIIFASMGLLFVGLEILFSLYAMVLFRKK